MFFPFTVLPVLSDEGRQQWLVLNQQKEDGMLTEKGFNKRQIKILLKEGLYKEDKQSSRQKQKSSSIDDSSDSRNDVERSSKTKGIEFKT